MTEIDKIEQMSVCAGKSGPPPVPIPTASPDTPEGACGSATEYYCGHCAREIAGKPWPVEPLYSMREAALLIPTSSPDAVRSLLNHNKDRFPARYRFDRFHTRFRLVTASEVRALREMVVRGKLR